MTETRRRSEESGENKDGVVAGTVFAPFSAAILVPSGAVAVCVALGVLVLLAGLAVVGLAFLPQQKRKDNSIIVGENEQTAIAPESEENKQVGKTKNGEEKPQAKKRRRRKYGRKLLRN